MIFSKLSTKAPFWMTWLVAFVAVASVAVSVAVFGPVLVAPFVVFSVGLSVAASVAPFVVASVGDEQR